MNKTYLQIWDVCHRLLAFRSVHPSPTNISPTPLVGPKSKFVVVDPASLYTRRWYKPNRLRWWSSQSFAVFKSLIICVASVSIGNHMPLLRSSFSCRRQYAMWLRMSSWMSLTYYNRHGDDVVAICPLRGLATARRCCSTFFFQGRRVMDRGVGNLLVSIMLVLILCGDKLGDLNLEKKK